MSEVVIVDGALAADGRIAVRASGGALHHGLGLFETLRSPAPRGLRFAARHHARLCRASGHLGLPDPPALETWLSDLLLARDAAGDLGDARVRWMWMVDGAEARRVLTLDPAPWVETGPVAVRTLPSTDPTRRSLPELKSFNWLGPRLALSRAGDAEPVWTDDRGRLLEGARSTLFVIRERRLMTAPVDAGVLPGVGREVLIEIAAGAGFEVVQEAPSGNLESEDALALVSSAGGVRAVERLDGRVLTPVRTEILRLAAAFDRRATEETGAGPVP